MTQEFDNKTRTKNLVICRGVATIPARFWEWAVCTSGEYTEEMCKQGWVKSSCLKYLSERQRSLLSEMP